MLREPNEPRRRPLRFPEYDYSQGGAYFVTICTQNKVCLFGDVTDGAMRLSKCGYIVLSTWNDLPKHYPNVTLDVFSVMPNHIHGIVIMKDPERVGLKPTPTNKKRYGLSEIVRALKTFSARRINKHRGTPGTHVWQRNYWEHIVRNEDALNRIREYILDNPMQWTFDRENPNAAVHAQPLPSGELWRV